MRCVFGVMWRMVRKNRKRQDLCVFFFFKTRLTNDCRVGKSVKAESCIFCRKRKIYEMCTKRAADFLVWRKLVINRGGGREIIRLPKCLCQELLSYAKRSGITTGPLFLTRQKKPMRRTQISDSIRRMCLEAKIPEGKGNPRCLRKLYKETMRSIYANMDFLFAKAYEQILDQEQLIYGWEESVWIGEQVYGQDKRHLGQDDTKV